MSSPERKTAPRAAKKEQAERKAESEKARAREETESSAKKQKKEEEESKRGETEEIGVQVSASQASEKAQQEPANPKPNSGTQQPEPHSTPYEVKCKQIRQQLELYLHAKDCLRRERLEDGAGVVCSTNYCKVMRDVMKHMPTCQITRNCPVMHCSSTRQIVGHWNSCKYSKDCPVCGPLRDLDRVRRADNFDNIVIDMERPIDVSEHIASLKRQAKTAKKEPKPTSTHQSVSTIAGIADVQKQLLFLAEFFLQEDSTTGDPHSLDFDVNDTPIPSRVAWDWHRTVLPPLRKHILRILIQMLIVTSERPLTLERHLQDMTLYCQKIENFFYEKAESKSRYFYFLAEQIYTLRVEFADKQDIYKQKVDTVGELLETGTITVPVDPPSERADPQTRGQRDNSPDQQRARQIENARVHLIEMFQRWRPTTGSQSTSTSTRTSNGNLNLDSILEPHQKGLLQLWHTKERLWIFEKQQMEQTVPGSMPYYDTEEFLTL